MRTLAKIFLLILPFTVMAQKPINTARLTLRLDSLMSANYSPDAPGAALLIAKNGIVLYDDGRGIANVNTKEKITGNTVFNIASITKQFTAIAALKLQEMGLISLEDNVAKYFPEFKSDIWKKVKLKHLLSHSSGVIDARPRTDHDFVYFATDVQSIQYMKTLDKLRFEPGTNYEYVNPTFDLFYVIIEKVTGETFENFQKKYIFDKAQMNNVRYFSPEKVIPNVAHGYIVNEDAVVTGLDSDTDKKRTKKATDYVDSKGVHWAECDYGEETFFATKADGGIYTSTRDFLNWELALRNNLVVNEASKRQAYKPHTLVSGSKHSNYQNRENTSYGLGWFIETKPNCETKIYHTGDNGGFQAYAAKYEDSNVNVIMFENRNDNDRWKMQLQIEQILREENVFTGEPKSGNPIAQGWYADPEGIVFGDHYWIYPTFSAEYDDQLFFDAFSSPDLVKWTKHEKILTKENISWLRRALWAPAVVENKGKYYIFFGANDIQNNNELGGIGVAVADAPDGPFVDALGKPLIGQIINGAQPIDQFVYRDDDGKWYMYYGGWGHCNVVRLSDDLLSVIPFEDGVTYKEITPEKYVEGPFMLKRGGKYYFMWSEGGWGGPDYSVAYAISDNPFGPFKREGKILWQDKDVATGAGHHSVIQVPGEDEYYIVYHRRPLNETGRDSRAVCVDKLEFDKDGKIKPVKMTFEGVGAKPIKDSDCYSKVL